ncbi:hypothetical protein BT96DRAFT_966437 [Gymnopus androsaceus JB14]|uniref:Uncharacterized protein n=1 Tax=Gymnopus androsaceus JB14 TaxID=1447944 RepID=A0A6A4HG63_9AGAR|nr:hypothetical protein BT96DRAFT_966437 [Gymnopus androsaceus JB14]
MPSAIVCKYCKQNDFYTAGALSSLQQQNVFCWAQRAEHLQHLVWRALSISESSLNSIHNSATSGKDCTLFHCIHDDQILKGQMVLGLFRDNNEWELAKWLIKNVGHNQTDAFLKLPIIRNKTSPEYENKKEFLEQINDLPVGVDWKLHCVKLTGDLVDENQIVQTEEVELWCQDPVECIQELVGNPMFKDVMRYAPQCLFEDVEQKEQVVNEMWTAEWWWKIQKLLPPNAMVAPVILFSDKTQLSRFRGDKSAWPALSHATVLIGYLPVAKLDCYSNKSWQFACYWLFHHCIHTLLGSLVEAGTNGVAMTCGDTNMHWIFPILVAYVVDYPEQCLIACCMENCCPLCKVAPTSRGSSQHSDPQSEAETIELLKRKASDNQIPEFKKTWTDLGIRPVFRPFWVNLPYSEMFEGFITDLLHQLHKGVFKDHLIKWCTQLMGLFHFKNGISGVSQWTGSKHKAMEKVFLPLVVGILDDCAVKAVCTVIDFVNYSSLQSHTFSTLLSLQKACHSFHEHRDVFIELEAHNPPHFNIPKIHSMLHYIELIIQFGSADDYTIQMTRWLQRQEATDRFMVYLEWIWKFKDSEGVSDYFPLLSSVNIIQNSSQSPSVITASHFLPALQLFLSAHNSIATARWFDLFNLYKCLILILPEILEAKPTTLKNIVRASPLVPSIGCCPEEPAHLDFALVHTGEHNRWTEGTSLKAHVRVLFTLPCIYGLSIETPLAYVEWFTPFSTCHSSSGLYSLSCSTCMRHVYGKIVDAGCII